MKTDRTQVGADSRNGISCNSILIWIARAAVLACVTFVPARMAGQVYSNGNSGEIGIYGGGTVRLGSPPTVGATAATALHRLVWLVLDVGYMPLGNETLRNHHGQIAPENSRLYDVSLLTHIRIPIRGPVEPYGIVGGGVLHCSYDVRNAIPDNNVGRQSEDNFGFHTGGGLRYYVRENWGIRAEYKVTISNQNFSRVSAGIFYQFD